MFFARDFRRAAWVALKGNWGIMAVMTLVYAVIIGVCSIIPGIGSVLVLLISGPLVVGFCGASLKVMRNEKPDVTDLFDGFQNFANCFLLHLLNGIFIVLWSLLFFIPGLVKSYSYSMSYYILRDYPGMTQSEARRASMAMMDGHKWRLFCLQFSFFGWSLLVGLTGGLLGIWVAPYMQTATAAFYEDLKTRQAHAVTAAPAPVAEAPAPVAEPAPAVITEEAPAIITEEAPATEHIPTTIIEE